MEKHALQLSMSENNIARIENQLSKILNSSHFKSANKMKQFLAYVVEKTLEGKGAQLKQYTIAVEALDFSDDFDSDTNPAVRILAGRVRDRLIKYYENDGVNDTLVIILSKGQYSASFEERKITASPASEVKVKVKFKLNKLKCFYGAVLATLIGIVFAVFHHEIAELFTEETPVAIPIVDIMPFEDLSGDGDGEDHDHDHSSMLTQGIRYQLLTELSQFITIRVRDVDAVSNQANKVKSAKYRIKGGLLTDDKTLQMNILLQDVGTNEVLWTKKISAVATDAGFNELIYKSVNGIISKIIDSHSVIQETAMKQLRERLDRESGVVMSSYECMLLFYHFDHTKDSEAEREARECLAEYTSKGVENSTLWAAHGFMSVLDWSKRTDQSDNSLREKARKSFDTALRIDPDNALAHEFYGNYLLTLERYDEAMVSYEKAKALNPSKPGIHVMIGWNKVSNGDWENGIKEIREGIEISYHEPGYFHIPVAVDAFRREDYKESLQEAQTIISLGDNRGIALALAPAIKLGQDDLVKRYTKEYSEYRKDDLTEPLREVRNVLKAPKVLDSYEETIRPVLEGLKQK